MHFSKEKPGRARLYILLLFSPHSPVDYFYSEFACGLSTISTIAMGAESPAR